METTRANPHLSLTISLRPRAAGLACVLALSALLLLALSGCTVKVPLDDNLLEGAKGFSLIDDASTHLLWGSSETVKGHQSGFTVRGRCEVGIVTVDASVDGGAAVTVPCEDGGFSVTFAAPSYFTVNRKYALTFVARLKDIEEYTVTIKRVYDRYLVDANTLVTFVTPSASTTSTPAASVDVEGTCASVEPGAISFKLNATADWTTCQGGGTFRKLYSLAFGANPLAFAWTDDYGNAGARTFQVIRNDDGGAVLVASSLSFAGSVGTLTPTDPDHARLATVRGLATDFNRRAGQAPSAVNPSASLPLGIDPDPSSACRGLGTCDTGAMAFGGNSVIYGP